MVENGSYRRSKLHQAVWEEIRDCPKCPDGIDKRMRFWRNVQADDKSQFEFSICDICGYTIILQRYIGDAGAVVDFERPDFIKYLHSITKVSRVVKLKTS